ncbi:MAG: dCTP deaminase [Candidatus Nanopelagicaceae bacterium]|nr:dCTP deaminase [Candidatus Nanopelagicaceae bacterium]
MSYGPLPDHEIRDLHIITPCDDRCDQINGIKVPSWGLQSYGYDCRLDENEFYVFSNAFSNARGGLIDPRNFDRDLVVQKKPLTDDDGLSYFIVPSNGSALGLTKESFNMPPDVIGQVYGKSTYSRCALVINCTLIEPQWRGRLVVELHNAAPIPIKVYASAGICQVVFLRGTECRNKYQGKYQNQWGLETAKA